MAVWRTYQHNQTKILSREVKTQECRTSKQFVYQSGAFRCRNVSKYFSYQPPGGGWNNQRVAFENAVIIALLLQRILIVQPLAPHDEMLKQKARWKRSEGYTIYNLLSAQQLVPISTIIDIKRLSFVVPVQEITSNHNDFINEYSETLSWYNVCRNGFTQAWIDEVHGQFNNTDKNINQIEKVFKLTKAVNVPIYRRGCIAKGENHRGVWEFLPELRKREEQMIYFEKGSLFVKNLYFTNKMRALRAQQAVIDYIQPAQDVVWHIKNIIHAIGKPFNAIHVRKTNHRAGKYLPVRYWLSRLTQANALPYSNKLYIATDELNSTWFKPLVMAGYRIYFARDFELFREFLKNNPVTGKDIIGFHEQIICSEARIFIPSYYSTFSNIIQRYREARLWNRKKFRVLNQSSVKWLNDSSIIMN